MKKNMRSWVTIWSNDIKRHLLLLIVFVISFNAWAQTESVIAAKNSTLVSNRNILPFWFTANNHGKIINSGSVVNVFDLNVVNTTKSRKHRNLSFSFGSNLVGAIAKESYFQMNQLLGGINFNGWKLEAGQFYDKTNYEGLSTTNGILVRSENARPYPLVRFSTAGYKPISFIKELQFKAEYDEGILIDKRFVKNPHMHHKSFYLMLAPKSPWQATLGIEHYVMWGGTSPIESYGSFPSDFNSYIKYVTGASGDKNFPMQDQINIAGNHLGSYQFEFKRELRNASISLYLSHIFDATESVKLKNWPDNLIGLFIDFKDKNQFVTHLIYEFTNTRHQGINDSIYVWDETNNDWERIYNDSYFTHFLYKSGYTFHQKVMGSPLFFPVTNNKDLSSHNYASIESTRFVAHHFGAKGNLTNYLAWKSMLTWVKHLGTYVSPYKYAQKQLSGIFELKYSNPRVPVEINCSAAFDAIRRSKNIMGFQFSIGKTW